MEKRELRLGVSMIVAILVVLAVIGCMVYEMGTVRIVVKGNVASFESRSGEVKGLDILKQMPNGCYHIKLSESRPEVAYGVLCRNGFRVKIQKEDMFGFSSTPPVKEIVGYEKMGEQEVYYF